MTASSEGDTVAVIVPAYDAEATLGETLRSVRSQTHRALEILVVDDGSRDRTPEIAAAHAAADPRVRLLRQANAGAAAARNRGIAEARAGLVAPVDADDLWAPAKIERQLAALRRGGPSVGLVYTWSAPIDGDGRIVAPGDRPTDEGDVLARLCRGNLVGNGSAALMPRTAVLEAGGYDTTLRAQGAQGCEDLLLYCRIAARRRFAVVPEFLTGYRQRAGSMSRDALQMMRSWQLVAAELRRRHPERVADIDAGEAYAVRWLLRSALRQGRVRDAIAIAGPPNGRGDVLAAATLVAEALVAGMAGALGRRALGAAERLVQRRPSPSRLRFPVTSDQGVFP